MSSLAAVGHVAAVKPLVRAAVDDGAEVRILVDAAGAVTFVDVGAAVVALPPMDAALAAWSDRAWGEAAGLGARGDLDGSNRTAIREGFGAVNARRVLPILREQLADFAPDLVLADPFEPGAIIAADEAGVPLALASWSVSGPLPDWVALLLDGAAEATGSSAASALAKASRSIRSSPVPGCLDRVPGPWPEPVRWHPSEHIPRRQEGSLAKPFMYATLGSVVGSIPPLANRFLACLGPAARALGMDCLVTVGNEAVIDALEVPAGLDVERFVSHAEVMSRAEVVVSHGGINTVLDAATCGVPQLVLPMQATDQHHTAQSLANFGAGIALPPDQQSPQTVEGALRSLFESPAARRRALELSDEMAKLPSVETAWRAVREWCADQHPVV